MRKIITIIAVIGVIAIAAAVILAGGDTGEGNQRSGSGQIDSADRGIVEDAVEGIEIGNKPPDFSLVLLDGTEVRLSDYKGKVVYLNFWATWCGPCVAEMPDMQKIYEKYGDKIVMLAINAGGEDDQTVSDFMKDRRYTFQAGLDREGQISGQYQITAIPATFVIDRQGLISAKNLGMMRQQEMESVIDMALNQKEEDHQ